MKSAYGQTKMYLEELFQELWCETPIHFVGEEFDSNDIDKWINPYYEASYSTLSGYGGLTVNSGNLYVACWGKVELDSLMLSDRVIDFMNTNIDKSIYRVLRFEISDKGWMESNDVFTVVSFSIETLNGTC